MRSLPDALDEDTTLVSGLPGSVRVLVIDSQVDQLVHVCGNDGAIKYMHQSVLQHLNPLVSLQLEVVQVIVVDVNLMAEIGTLTLLDADEAVASEEAQGLVSARKRVPVDAGSSHRARLVQMHRGLAVVLRPRRLVVLLVPVDHVAPQFGVSLHPFSHQRQPEGHFDDPVSDDLHPLEELLVRVDGLCEKGLEPLGCKAAVDRRVGHYCRLQHVLE